MFTSKYKTKFEKKSNYNLKGRASLKKKTWLSWVSTQDIRLWNNLQLKNKINKHLFLKLDILKTWTIKTVLFMSNPHQLLFAINCIFFPDHPGALKQEAEPLCARAAVTWAYSAPLRKPSHITDAQHVYHYWVHAHRETAQPTWTEWHCSIKKSLRTWRITLTPCGHIGYCRQVAAKAAANICTHDIRLASNKPVFMLCNRVDA